ncbi:hypothetical protein N9B60_04785, partial [Mariniblastus sp.]|nr:hypothetical protein [Mariniblastus sp.]
MQFRIASMQSRIANKRNGGSKMEATDVTHGIREAVGCLDRKDAADYLSISTRLLDKIAAAGEIPRIKIRRKTVFR